MQARRLSRVYIGAVGSEVEVGDCRDSIQNIKIRPGDIGPKILRATKGYEGRQEHFNFWLNKTDCGAMLLLDADMYFEPDTLERLRSHGLPYVSGYYMRRMMRPIVPVMYEYPEDDSWPQVPLTEDLERGKLHKIGGSGWGCVLIHREVAEAVYPLLKGEWFVLEDDMDIYPYDLKRIMAAIHILQENVNAERMNREDITEAVSALAEEIRPLRGINTDVVGSDIRFPYFARLAGYDLICDPDVRCGHNLYYPLHPDDYTRAESANQQDGMKDELASRVQAAKMDHEHIMKELAEA